MDVRLRTISRQKQSAAAVRLPEKGKRFQDLVHTL
jgi:hypothetical protein